MSAQPQVAYRETITKAVDGRLHAQEADRRFGPVRPRVSVELRAGQEPGPASSSRARSSAARCRGNTSRGREGHQAQLEAGVLAGFPVIDFKATLLSTAPPTMWIRRAWRSRSRPARRSARPWRRAARSLLEPMMKVEVVTPGGLHGRRHRRSEQPPRAGQRHGETPPARQRPGDRAMVPLANMFGYVNTLRSMSQGRAQYTWNSTITSRCRRRSRTKSAPSWLDRQGREKTAVGTGNRWARRI